MAASIENAEVNIGFVEQIDECDKWKLHSAQFPSKLGGKPAWLSLNALPKADLMSCPNCQDPMIFLLQIYCPLIDDDEKVDCFHRSLFIFICKNTQCSQLNKSPNFKVFRCQLPRENKFYGYEPPLVKSIDLDLNFDTKCDTLCEVCGCYASKRCSKCKQVNYCSQNHQKLDWKYGHKSSCGMNNKTKQGACLLFDEAELVTEPESLATDEKEKSEEEKMTEYEEFMKSNKSHSFVSGDDRNLQKMALSDEDTDKVFKEFKKRVAHEPEQVLRYSLGGQPLWVCSDNIPNSGEIPSCECGAKRQFEFQVMPQLLCHLKLDKLENSIDWGTLAVYTCSENCSEGAIYHPEFLWKQDYS
ncbi:programmed cell death protein 2-like [Tubulanus polymorphus]|uniref:programmed cell death protein 2-like n=1 Tax=Tubulanus polymorphus TaxID=672921 RepID=UPI003DA5FCAE